MGKYILGLNAIGINTSASIIKDNKIIAAVEEERLTRDKRTRNFPEKSIEFCLNKLNINITDLDYIAISWNPLINLEKFNKSYNSNLEYLPNILHSSLNHLIKNQNLNDDFMSQKIRIKNKDIEVFFIKHHLSHASSVYFSNFNKSAILTADAFGEKETSVFYNFQNEKIINKIRNIVTLKKNGLFELDLNFFNHYQFHRPKYYNDNLINLLGVEPGSKSNDDDLKKIYYEIANGAQTVFEEIYFHMISHLKKVTKRENIVLGGGCALNCLANGKITKKTGFKNIFVSPVPDDNGAGLGAAAYVYKNIINSKKKFNVQNYFLGPSSDEKTILSKLKKYQIKYQKLQNVESHAAISISKGLVIGWFQGNIEFGDRALGNRSILADPRNKNMKKIVNEKIKYREKFRPFAPAVLEEEAYKYFDNLKNSNYMEMALMVKKNKINLIPAVTHIDGTARLQTVTKKFNKKFYDLINEFYKLTNIPILLNTSFNIQGEPIVCSVEDALKNFYLSGLDIMYLNNFVIKK